MERIVLASSSIFELATIETLYMETLETIKALLVSTNFLGTIFLELTYSEAYQRLPQTSKSEQI